MHTNISLRSATALDREFILDVMKPWNMHHVPSPEMGELDLSKFFLVQVLDKIVGAAGYEVFSPELGKTTLLGVLPEFIHLVLGKKLQHERCKAMFELGIKRVITNADRPETIEWYKKNYGYREVGRIEKISPFGLVDVDHWTTLEMDLIYYMSSA